MTTRRDALKTLAALAGVCAVPKVVEAMTPSHASAPQRLLDDSVDITVDPDIVTDYGDWYAVGRARPHRPGAENNSPVETPLIGPVSHEEAVVAVRRFGSGYVHRGFDFGSVSCEYRQLQGRV